MSLPPGATLVSGQVPKAQPPPMALPPGATLVSGGDVPQPTAPAQQETGIWAGVKRNTVGMVAGLYHAFTDPATDQEKQDLLSKAQSENQKAGTTDPGDPNHVPEDLATDPSRATLALHRLIDAPAATLSKHADDEEGAAKTLLANGEVWKGANQYLSGVTDKALSAVPMAGPWISGVAQRAESGDVTGAGTDLAMAHLYGKAGDVSGVPGGKMSDVLRDSAQKNYESVLNPTKVSTKYQTQKMMPQLMDERPRAWTRQGLADQAAAQADEAGQQIEQHVSGMQGSMNTQPVIDALQNLKKANQVNGVSLRPEVDSAVDSVSDQMQQLGSTIPLQDAVKARRILDNAVSEAKGYQGAQLSDASMAAIRKEAANSLRSELAQASPDLAALNAKFHFWNSLSDAMDATIQRKTGQVNAFPKLKAGIAGAAGFIHGGPIGAAATSAAFAALDGAFHSTAWQTVSAATKLSLADALAAGKVDSVVGILGKAGLAGQVATGGQDSQDDSDTPKQDNGPISSLMDYDPIQARQAFKSPIVQHALNTLNPGAADSLIKKYGVVDTRRYWRGANA
jgi:hypothetical protein